MLDSLKVLQRLEIYLRRSFHGRVRPAYVVLFCGLYLLLLTLAVVYNSLATPHVARYLELPSSKSSLTPPQCLTREFLERPSSLHLSKLRQEYECGCRQPDMYEEHEQPRVTAIIQSFNHQDNVERIANALKGTFAVEEIIVCEDGSEDNSLEKWMEHLPGLKHFVVLSNNLHETRCYNRAMRMSSSEFYIMMQDDDIPPSLTPSEASDSESVQPLDWVSEAISLFEADPNLGVLSGFIGHLWSGKKGYEFGEQQSDHGGLNHGDTRRIPFLSRATRAPFMYVECAWAAPLFIRAKAVRRIGGFDINLYKKRQPGVWQDCVLSYEAWKMGWRVGLYEAKFERRVGVHETTRNKKMASMRDEVWRKAEAYLDESFDRKYISGFALYLNNHTLDNRFAVR